MVNYYATKDELIKAAQNIVQICAAEIAFDFNVYREEGEFAGIIISTNGKIGDEFFQARFKDIATASKTNAFGSADFTFQAIYLQLSPA